MRTISFKTPSEQCNWFQTPAGGVCVIFALLSFRSEWSQGFRICARLEVRPRPDVALVFFVFFVCSSLQRWLCYRWDCSVCADGAGHTSDGENRDLGTFVLFLVQYAVHKSLALQILRFLLFLLLLNGYIAVFFPLNLYEQLKGLVLFFCFSLRLI